MPNDQRLLQWRNLPMELRLKRQWLVAHPVNKNPLFHSNNQFYNASVSKHLSSQWMSFEDATTLALTHNLAIGFVIMEGEDITCIDLDVKPKTTKETLDLYQTIVKSFDSYTERSVGGNGIHIWCKGSIGLGRRRDGVEIYSQNRFMICTGNVLHLKEHLEPRQAMLTNMISQMPMSADYSEIVLEELPQIESDEDVGRKLWENEDARMLWQGMWQELDHPSQSEGDLDLMVHLVRHSPSNIQCQRLFRQSNLGKRTKANRIDYVLRTLRHARYIRQSELVDIEMGKKSTEAIVAKYDAEQALLRAAAASSGSAAIDYSYERFDYSDPIPEVLPAIEEDEKFALGFPPGGLGYMAHFFYKGSIYPNVDFCVAAAISTMSAICGRAWNTSTRSGLNTYNLVVAPSGMGKEEMSKGIRRLIKLCEVPFPRFKDFFYFGHFASAQGLAKRFSLDISSFAQIMSEFGGMIKRFSNSRDENTQGLMSLMLDIHSKSGPDSSSNAITYSDATKNVLSIDSPSYSILGDTTPEVFESVNSFLLNNGFVSRFNIFEYKGLRSDINENVDHSIDPAFVKHMVILAMVANEISRQKKSSIVASLDAGAQIRYNRFKKFCNDNYNAAIAMKGQDIEHNLWSRSLNRINVLATLAAILDAPQPSPDGTVIPPIVTEAHWDYFERIVMNDINNFKTKQESGDLGSGHSVQLTKLNKVLDDYLSKPIPESYRVRPDLQTSGKITYSFLRVKMQHAASFKVDGNFNERSFRDAIQTLVQMGRLKEIRDPAEKGATTGALYRILNSQ